MRRGVQMKLLLTGRAPCAASREKIFPARFMKQISLQSIKKSLIIWRGCLFTTAKKDNNIIAKSETDTTFHTGIWNKEVSLVGPGPREIIIVITKDRKSVV